MVQHAVCSRHGRRNTHLDDNGVRCPSRPACGQPCARVCLHDHHRYQHFVRPHITWLCLYGGESAWRGVRVRDRRLRALVGWPWPKRGPDEQSGSVLDLQDRIRLCHQFWRQILRTASHEGTGARSLLRFLAITRAVTAHEARLRTALTSGASTRVQDNLSRVAGELLCAWPRPDGIAISRLVSGFTPCASLPSTSS